METLSLFAILSVVVQKIVEWVRGRFPQLESDYVRVAAVAVGTALAWAAGINVEEVLSSYGLPIQDIPEWLSYLGSGAAIGFGAGAVADLLNRSSGGQVVNVSGRHVDVEAEYGPLPGAD